MTDYPDLTPDRKIRGKLVVPPRRVGDKTVVTVQEENGRVRKITGKLIGGSRYEMMYGWASDNRSSTPVGDKTIWKILEDDDTVCEVTGVTGQEGWPRKTHEDINRRRGR